VALRARAERLSPPRHGFGILTLGHCRLDHGVPIRADPGKTTFARNGSGACRGGQPYFGEEFEAPAPVQLEGDGWLKAHRHPPSRDQVPEEPEIRDF
jgi:hypothetical protein